MSQSILNSTKKVLGLPEDHDGFDLDVMMHINSVLSIISQLGVGPQEGFMIEDAEATWSDFVGNDKLVNMVKSLVYVRVRLLFDPPTTGFTTTALQEQAKEMEWRLNVAVDNVPLPLEPELVWVVDDTLPEQTFPRQALNGEVGIDPVTGNVWRNVE